MSAPFPTSSPPTCCAESICCHPNSCHLFRSVTGKGPCFSGLCGDTSPPTMPCSDSVLSNVITRSLSHPGPPTPWPKFLACRTHITLIYPNGHLHTPVPPGAKVASASLGLFPNPLLGQCGPLCSPQASPALITRPQTCPFSVFLPVRPPPEALTPNLSPEPRLKVSPALCPYCVQRKENV